MTWYEDVDRRLDNIEKVLVRILPLVNVGVPDGAPAGQPPERSVSSVTPIADDDEDADLDLPPDPVPVGCTHQHQRLDSATKRILCARCGEPLGQPTGVVQSSVTKNGRVVPPPAGELPGWAVEAMRGAPQGPER